MIGHGRFDAYAKPQPQPRIVHRRMTGKPQLRALKLACKHDLVEAYSGPLWSPDREQFKHAIVTVCYLCGKATTELSEERDASTDPGGL